MNHIEHPPHYNSRSVECIEVVEHLPFCIGNAIKYLWREGLKGARMDDLEKARWYALRAQRHGRWQLGLPQLRAEEAFAKVEHEFDGDVRHAIKLLLAARYAEAVEAIDDVIRVRIGVKQPRP